MCVFSKSTHDRGAIGPCRDRLKRLSEKLHRSLPTLFFRPGFVAADKDKPVDLCLLMVDITVEALVAYLQQAEVAIFWGPVMRHGAISVYVYDPDGVHVELRVETAAVLS